MIYANEPSSWQDLQQKVCDILAVCGCESAVEKTIATVRGDVSVDVYAADHAIKPSLTYICECKYWSTPVTKTIVHSFRTVVADSGVHLGYIISRSGFQSGAFAAAHNSNLKLVTWTEFQGIFLDRWKEARYEQLKPGLEDLFEFYDYFYAPIGNAINGKKDGRKERLAEFEG